MGSKDDIEDAIRARAGCQKATCLTKLERETRELKGGFFDLDVFVFRHNGSDAKVVKSLHFDAPDDFYVIALDRFVSFARSCHDVRESRRYLRAATLP